MEWLLHAVAGRFIRRGSLRITTAKGEAFTFGDGTGQPVAIRFTTRAAMREVMFDPELKFGEAYMDGTLVVDEGSIADVLHVICQNDAEATRWGRPLYLLRYWMRRWQQTNVRPKSQRNVAHHYDLDERLYSLFLDADRQYSCGYFETPAQSLDDAQLAKKRHLAAKLLTQRGQRVLDIGCGWGGLALYLAEFCGTQVKGITLSKEQHAIAQQRAAEKRLAGIVDFQLEDYRDVQGPFDRIISVGMFEHVGLNYYETFFRRCGELLSNDGVMLLHSIGRSEGPGITNPWVAKYIFPGGYIPALSEVLPYIERAGLLITDIEILRLHYAETLKSWRERFLAHKEEVQRIYAPRFVRMWEFYLAAAEVNFRDHAAMVFQIQLTKRQGVVPMTRDYIQYEERRLRAAESGQRAPLRLAGE
jgi:cyclopropane-fatty-acyl-phospholipid synthase